MVPPNDLDVRAAPAQGNDLFHHLKAMWPSIYQITQKSDFEGVRAAHSRQHSIQDRLERSRLPMNVPNHH